MKGKMPPLEVAVTLGEIVVLEFLPASLFDPIRRKCA